MKNVAQVEMLLQEVTLVQIRMGHKISSQNLLRWKIFELDGCDGAGKACLVFPPKSEGAQVIEN